MECKISGKKLLVEFPIAERPRNGGKTIVVATTKGNKAVKTDDRTIYVNVNAFYYPAQEEQAGY